MVQDRRTPSPAAPMVQDRRTPSPAAPMVQDRRTPSPPSGEHQMDVDEEDHPVRPKRSNPERAVVKRRAEASRKAGKRRVRERESSSDGEEAATRTVAYIDLTKPSARYVDERRVIKSTPVHPWLKVCRNHT